MRPACRRWPALLWSPRCPCCRPCWTRSGATPLMPPTLCCCWWLRCPRCPSDGNAQVLASPLACLHSQHSEPRHASQASHSSPRCLQGGRSIRAAGARQGRRAGRAARHAGGPAGAAREAGPASHTHSRRLGRRPRGLPDAADEGHAQSGPQRAHRAAEPVPDPGAAVLQHAGPGASQTPDPGLAGSRCGVV